MSLPRYPEYRDSGVEWLGEVPAHWAVMRLRSLASLNDEVLPEDAAVDHEIEYVDIGSVSLADGIQRTQPMSFSAAPSRARRIVRHGDILVSTVRTYLKAIAPVIDPPDNLIASTGFAVVRPKEPRCSTFLKYGLQCESFIHQVIARSTGVSYPAINVSDLALIELAVPPLGEQEVIGSFLDRETAKIDALIAEQEKLLALLAEKRQASISHVVTRGLDPDAPKKDSGIPWLGAVPAHWEVRSIKSLAGGEDTLFMDGDWIESRNISEDGIRYITTGNVGPGYYKEQGSGFITESTFIELNCTEVVAGDVLISRLNMPIGRACVVPDFGLRVVTSVDNVIFRPINDVDRDYLVYRFSGADYLHEAANLASGATMQRISRTELGAIRVAIPPMSEQQEIKRHLSHELSRLEVMIAEAEGSNNLLRERRSALIAAAVTGQIDVRSIAEEQAAWPGAEEAEAPPLSSSWPP